MGVVHKLKKEVIDYILDQKQSNPKLGCRKLAEMTSEKFEIKVSKSSINTILKQANLSNSVGRPAKVKVEKKKKFEIPAEKKIQISQDLTKIPIPTETEGVTTPQENDPTKSEAVQTMSDSGQTEEMDAIKNNVQSESGLDEEFLRSVETIRSRKQGLEEHPISNAGLTFMLAGVCECLSSNFYTELFRDLSLDINSQETIQALDFQILTRLEKNGPSDSGRNDLALLLPLQNEGVIGKITDSSQSGSFWARAELEIDQLKNMAQSFQIDFSDGRSLKLDTKLFQIGQKNDNFSTKLPLYKAISVLDSCIVSNSNTLCLLNSEGRSLGSPEIAALVESFEIPEQLFINEVHILDGESRSLSSLPFVVPKRREFIIGVHPSQPELKELVKSGKWAQRIPYYCHDDDTIYQYAKMSTDILNEHVHDLSQPLTVFAIWAHESPEPLVALVTNAETADTDILDAFMRKYVNQAPVSSNEDPSASQPIAATTIMNVDGMFEQLLSHVQAYVEGQYLSKYVSLTISDTFDRAATYRLDESHVYVTISAGSAADSKASLIHAVKEINSRDIRDRQGRRLNFDLI